MRRGQSFDRTVFQRGSASRPPCARLSPRQPKALAPDDPDVATNLNNLAGLYRAHGRYDDAEPLYKRSLAIFEKALGPDHRDVATSLDNLAALYRAQSRYGVLLRRRAILTRVLAMIDGDDRAIDAAYEAHPLYWAPFVVVGEGGSGR
jgi:tetratricopeptide (TPR) repeat protein